MIQVAGYCMYGSATELVITFCGKGVHRFTLDPSLGEFVHISADVKIPSKPKARKEKYGSPRLHQWSIDCIEPFHRRGRPLRRHFRIVLPTSEGKVMHNAMKMLELHPSQRIYSCNEGNFDSWDDEIKRAVTGFKTASSPWTQRYVGSMVSDVHRTLLYGGLFLYPADKKSPMGNV